MFSNDERLSRFTYWRHRYRESSGNKKTFDWFLSSDEMMEVIQQHLEDVNKCKPPGNRQLLQVLELGCGTSKLPLWLYSSSELSLQIILIDFIQEALEFQQDLICNSHPASADSQAFAVCSDVCSLPFFNDSFSVAIDKGTMDALLKDREQGEHKALLMMEEIMRVLHKGGRFIQISDEDPDARLVFLDMLVKKGKDREFLAHDEGVYKSCDRSEPSVGSVFSRDEGSVPIECFHKFGPSCKGRTSNEFEENFLWSSCSPWCFQTIVSKSDQEYFLYWIDRL